ncbi:DHA2 family efflux MFS transporter permease subunit [Streptomyces acidiscabies]|uniref:Multidrug transporter n=1 Tax=Streptomyces acidiscabies TaxID=42234 RepID=A0A0L0K5K9_9ACTN|nr:DHA2 family efflux MFS transporter permease subunit [Streptomyces acidiscabies]KND32979.1 multidrug transporter [Streptomyces acidiscabies]
MTTGISSSPVSDAVALNRTLGVILVGSLMVVLDGTIVVVALPSLSGAFGASLGTIQWTLTGYTLALAAVIPTAAWVMARLGAKRAYLLALGLFTFGSGLAAFAWDAGSLIAFRVVQGLGGGLLMPVGMAMALGLADRERFGRTMALIGLPVLIGPVSGPVLGGWLIDAASWHWIFLVNLPVGALALGLAVRLLRADVPRGEVPQLDVRGLVLLPPGLTLLLYGLARGGERGEFTSPGVLGFVVVGAVLVAAFVRHALTERHPLLDLRLLGDRTFALGIGTLALFACGYFGSALLGPMYWQQVRGWGATGTGLLGVPVGLAIGGTMQIAARRVDRVSPRVVIVCGAVLASIGMAGTGVQMGIEGVAAWRTLATYMLMGVGVGMVIMPTMTVASRDLPKERMGAASTALAINQQVAASVGTAFLSVLLGAAGVSPSGFRTVFLVAAGLPALAVVPALWLPGRRGGAEGG